MDPMDYTMDEAAGQAHNAVPRYQCQNPSPPRARNTFNSSSHAGRQYDPVHDTSRWHHGNNTNAAIRPPYAAPPYMQQWPSPFVPGNSWQGFGESARSNFGDSNRPAFGDMQRFSTGQDMPELPALPDFRAPRAYSDASWNAFEGRHGGYHPQSYRPFSNQLDDHTAPGESSIGPGSTRRNLPVSDIIMRSNHSAGDHGVQQTDPSNQPRLPVGREPPADTDSATRQQATPSLFGEPHRTRFPPRGLRTGFFRHAANDEATISRRTHSLDSDEDSTSELENEAARREVAREILYAEMEDDHSLAAMRGALAGSKKVPTKEAIASLEKLKVDEVPASDKTCIICYNEFGVSNPEGQIEQPIRLPKCKHIFGDTCIKKWFEDNDSCPYCRDKLPSESATKRMSMDMTMRIMQRERLRHAASARVRQGIAPQAGFFPEDTSAAERAPFQRNPAEEYNVMLNSQMETWGYSPNRYSPDSPERRRQGRGRVGTGRPGHPMGRPNSIGSARSISQSFNYHHQVPPRQFGHSNLSLHAPPTSRRSPMTGVSRQNDASPGSDGLSASPLPLASEEASPPVVVGSGVSARTRFGGANTSAPELNTGGEQSHSTRLPYQPPGSDAYGPMFSASTTLRRSSPPGVDRRENEPELTSVRMTSRWSR